MTQDLLDKYNELRKSKGMPTFQRWTGSTEDLQDAYHKLNGDKPQPAVTTPTPKKAKAPKAESKPQAAKAPEKKPAKATPADDGSVKLADICKELKVAPRAARIKLRAAYKKDKGLPATAGDTWAWKKGDVAKIKGLLSK